MIIKKNIFDLDSYDGADGLMLALLNPNDIIYAFEANPSQFVIINKNKKIIENLYKKKPNTIGSWNFGPDNKKILTVRELIKEINLYKDLKIKLAIDKKNVFYENKIAQVSGRTSKSIVLVTPDAERSMNTYLGASTQFNIDCINEDLIINSKIIYITYNLITNDSMNNYTILISKLKEDGFKLLEDSELKIKIKLKGFKSIKMSDELQYLNCLQELNIGLSYLFLLNNSFYF